MQTQRQAQVQRSPTERFVDLLGRVLTEGHMTGEMQVRLEDAFNDAVEAKINSLHSDYGVPDLIYPNLDRD